LADAVHPIERTGNQSRLPFFQQIITHAIKESTKPLTRQGGAKVTKIW
jgi:hypothetical protein